jgi:hypothetical protein
MKFLLWILFLVTVFFFDRSHEQTTMETENEQTTIEPEPEQTTIEPGHEQTTIEPGHEQTTIELEISTTTTRTYNFLSKKKTLKLSYNCFYLFSLVDTYISNNCYKNSHTTS